MWIFITSVQGLKQVKTLKCDSPWISYEESKAFTITRRSKWTLMQFFSLFYVNGRPPCTHFQTKTLFVPFVEKSRSQHQTDFFSRKKSLFEKTGYDDWFLLDSSIWIDDFHTHQIMREKSHVPPMLILPFFRLGELRCAGDLTLAQCVVAKGFCAPISVQCCQLYMKFWLFTEWSNFTKN